MASLMIDAEKCTKCGICMEECPANLIMIVGEGDLPSWVRGAETACLNCGHCVAVCPAVALELSSMSVDQCVPVIKELQPAPEQIEQFLKSRRVIRTYRKEPVEHGKLVKLFDIARYAPSGHNDQPVQWLVIEKREKVHQLAQMTIDWLGELTQKNPDLAKRFAVKAIKRSWEKGIDKITRGAPHLVIAHTGKDSIRTNDCYIALTYLELAAHSMGIGACWAGYIHAAATYSEPFARALELPDGNACFGAMMIGYPKNKFARIPVRNDAQVIWH